MKTTKTMNNGVNNSEVKGLYDDLHYMIASLTKEDLKKLFLAPTHEAYNTLANIITDNEKALSRLLGKPFKSERFLSLKKKVNGFMNNHKYIKTITTFLGAIIKMIIGFIKFGIALCVDIALFLLESIILLVRGGFRALKKLLSTIRDKAKSVPVAGTFDAKKVVEEAMDEVDETETMDEELQNETDKIKAMDEKLKAKINEAVKKNEELKAEINEAAKKNEKLQAEIDKAAKRKEELQAEIDEVAKDIEHYEKIGEYLDNTPLPNADDLKKDDSYDNDDNQINECIYYLDKTYQEIDKQPKTTENLKLLDILSGTNNYIEMVQKYCRGCNIELKAIKDLQNYIYEDTNSIDKLKFNGIDVTKHLYIAKECCSIVTAFSNLIK